MMMAIIIKHDFHKVKLYVSDGTGTCPNSSIIEPGVVVRAIGSLVQ
jgi:hypothetical protein